MLHHLISGHQCRVRLTKMDMKLLGNLFRLYAPGVISSPLLAPSALFCGIPSSMSFVPSNRWSPVGSFFNATIYSNASNNDNNYY